MKQVRRFFMMIGNFFYSLWCRLSRLARIAVLSGIAGIIILAIALPILLNREDGGRTVVETARNIMTVTPMPTSLPTATPEPTKAADPTLTPAPEPTPELHPGERQSYLTGEWMPEDEADKRPFAVMLNNLSIASPQSGIGEASILYEALTEAGITRFMGIFENIKEDSSESKRIGSVRSARHYFVSFADEYDAILVNYGRTTYAEKKIKKLKIDHLDGLDGVGYLVYYRDNTIKAPHNAFASLEGIQAGIENLKIRTEYRDDYTGHFTFSEEEIMLPGEKIGKISLGFSSYASPYFVYNGAEKEYVRYQFDKLHTDYNTGQALCFKNIIIQLVDEWNIDKNGYQTMDIKDTEGKGYYITNGGMTEITWKKNEEAKFMRYYDMAGKDLAINVGKTYIGVYPLFQIEKLIFNEPDTGETEAE